MKNMIKITSVSLTLLLVFALQACQTVEINFAPTESKTPQTSMKYASVALGIKEWSKPPEKVCEDQEPTKIVIRRTKVDALLHALIGGVYTWRRIDVYCK